MDTDRARRALEVFEATLDREPQERAAFVRGACGEDDGLFGEVQALLEMHDQASTFLPDDGVGEDVTQDMPAAQASVDAYTSPGPGVTLGDFQVEALIGAGGMGRVFRARQLSLQRDVALKVLPAQLQFSPRARKRFQHEIEAAARLHHTNLIGVFASGQARGCVYYAMELADGPTLGQVIRQLRAQPLPELRSASTHDDVSDDRTTTAQLDAASNPGAEPEVPGEASDALQTVLDDLSQNYFDRVATQMADVASGLDYAHQHGVIHRDIKPSNLLYSNDGTLHLGDFGLARILDEPGITQTGECIGTPYYMAPEQVAGGSAEIDVRTDVYALGATLYELLTLQPPFPGRNRQQVLTQIGRDPPRSPRRLNPRVPRDLETICLKALAIDPAERYGSAGAFADDLRRYVDRFAINARRAGPVARGIKFVRRHQALSAACSIALVLGVSASWLAYGIYREGRGRARAEQRLERAQDTLVRTQQTEQERLFERSLLAAMQGDLAAARDAIREAEHLGASMERLLLLRGQVDTVSADFQSAVAAFKEVLASDPGSLAAHALLAEAYARVDLWTLSREHRTEVFELGPASIEDLILAGRMESYHDPVEAERLLDRVVEIDRQNIVARLVRGTIRSQRAYADTDPAHAQRALDDLELAASLLPETAYILSSRLHVHLTAAAGYDTVGSSRSRDAHLDRARAMAERLAAYPDSYEARRWRAYYYERIGDLDHAIQEWYAIEDKTIGFLAMTLYRAGRFDDALDACARYRLHTQTGTPDFCTSFVMAAMASSREQVIRSFDFGRIVTMDPHSSRRSVFLLWCLAGDLDRAHEAVRNIDAPDDADTQALARVRFMSGEITADDFLRVAASSRLTSATAHLLIAAVHLAEGRRDAAREHLQRAIDCRQDFEFVTTTAAALLSQMDRDAAWPAWAKP